MKLYFNAQNNTDSLAITFDDGPHPIFTPKLVDILDYFNAKATFFMTGNNAAKHRDLVLRVRKQGHEIGSHSLNHLKKVFLSAETLMSEIKSTKDLIEDITSSPVTLYRPPYGFISPFLFQVCKKLNLKIILWNVQTHDYRREDSRIIIRRISKKIKAGSILLFHECNFKDASLDYSNTIKTVEYVLKMCLPMKIKPVTVTRMLEEIED